MRQKLDRLGPHSVENTVYAVVWSFPISTERDCLLLSYCDYSTYLELRARPLSLPSILCHDRFLKIYLGTRRDADTDDFAFGRYRGRL